MALPLWRVTLLLSILLTASSSWLVFDHRGLSRSAYSPAKVHRDHQHITACSGCHAPWRRLSNESCSVSKCHSSADFRTYRNRTVAESHDLFQQQSCLDCHWDHRGTDAGISKRFDHRSLERKTLVEWCAKCHRSSAARAHPKMTDRDCRGCHEDHRDWSSDWRHTDVDRMVEARARSIEVSMDLCERCHEEEHVYSDTEGFDCTSCHRATTIVLPLRRN